MIHRVEFEEAAERFLMADGVEKGAKLLREKERAIILQWFEENRQTLSSKDGVVYQEQGVQVSFPTKKGTPAHFNDELAADCIEHMHELGIGEVVDDLFQFTPTFRGPEAVLALAKKRPELAKTLAELLMAFTVPATDPEPMTPRVQKC